MSVLVIDGESNAGLTVTRSLGRKGIEVDVGARTNLAPSLFSKYCKKGFVYTNPEKNVSGFLEDLKRIVEKNDYEILFPCSDFTILPISLNRKFFEERVKLALPSNELLRLAWSKSKILRIARSIGIPTPKTFFVRRTEELKKIDKKINYPVVIKPESSKHILNNQVIDMQVKYANNFKELVENFKKSFVNGKAPLIQEVIKGFGLGFFALCKNGRVKAFFMHKRLREVSVDRGASTLRESIWDEEIEKYGVELLEKIKWHGVAMVEFKMDEEEGKPKLMEVNGRFWNSLPLAVAAGVDFPYLLYKLIRDGNVQKITSYKIGVRCRWLTGDTYRLIKILRGEYNKKLFQESLVKSIRDYLKFFDRDLHYDTFTLDDPKPAFADFLNSIEKLLRKGIV
ncbi:MAG: ATP-grasp domain-containing protein [Candidatus Aenigmatarchaeota archaeon]